MAKKVDKSLANLLRAAQFYSLEEVADLFSVTTRTVRRWVSSGKLTATRDSNGLLSFRKTEIDELCKWTEADQ